jgi:hypothetical protein
VRPSVQSSALKEEEKEEGERGERGERERGGDF